MSSHSAREFFKVGVSSVSPSSGWWRAKILNLEFLRWPIYLTNLGDIPNYLVIPATDAGASSLFFRISLDWLWYMIVAHEQWKSSSNPTLILFLYPPCHKSGTLYKYVNSPLMLAKRLSPSPKRVPLRNSLAITVILDDQIFCYIFSASLFAIFSFAFFDEKVFYRYTGPIASWLSAILYPYCIHGIFI